jgi:hypothetical protein
VYYSIFNDTLLENALKYHENLVSSFSLGDSLTSIITCLPEKNMRFFPENKFRWRGLQELPNESFVCGYCNTNVSSVKEYKLGQNGWGCCLALHISQVFWYVFYVKILLI